MEEVEGVTWAIVSFSPLTGSRDALPTLPFRLGQ